jgi:hypothetical protein
MTTSPDMTTSPATPTNGFARAFLAGDADAMVALLAPGVAFHSPVTDYTGARPVAKLLRTLVEVVPERRATSVLDAPGETIAVFAAHDDTLELDGVLRVVEGPDGRVARVMLWLRPLDALLEGVERMRTALARLRPQA